MTRETRDRVWTPPCRPSSPTRSARSTSTSTRPPSARSSPASCLAGLRRLVRSRCPGSGTAPARSGCAAARRPSTRRPARWSRSYASADEPLGVLHVRCGNRRAAECPSCSRLYAADTFHLIRAGVAGGKGVPEHGRRQPAGLRDPDRALVRARPRHPRTAHGAAPARDTGQDRCRARPARRSATAMHDDGDPSCSGSRSAGTATTTPRTWCGSGGRPSCGAGSPSPCAALLAQHLGVTRARLGELATPAVRQGRRVPAARRRPLPRPDPPRRPTDADDGFAPRPGRAHRRRSWPHLVEQAAAAVAFDRPTAPRRRPGPACWRSAPRSTPGPSATARRTDDPDRALTPEQVAGYLAKYATKSATDTDGHGQPPPAPAARDHRPAPRRPRRRSRRRGPAADAPVRAARQVGAHARLPRPLRHQVPPLLASPSASSAAPGSAPRPGSPRPTARAGTRRPARPRADLLADDADETTLVIGPWSYAGSGWDTDGDTALANAAAARAREYAQERAQRRRRRTVGE